MTTSAATLTPAQREAIEKVVQLAREALDQLTDVFGIDDKTDAGPDRDDISSAVS